MQQISRTCEYQSLIVYSDSHLNFYGLESYKCYPSFVYLCGFIISETISISEKHTIAKTLDLF